MNIQSLISTAKGLVKPMKLSRESMDAATVGCALVTTKGNVYTGVCIHLSCGVGFCAEHAAVAEMIKNQETEIKAIVAYGNNVLTPCGRCRELLVQVNHQNFKTTVVISETETKTLKELLPDHWLQSEE